MRRHFYVSDFWDVQAMDELKKADQNKYAIAVYSYKDHPYFIASEDDVLSDYLASLENKTPERFLIEIEIGNILFLQYYNKVSKGLVIIGNENMLKDSSTL